MSHTRIIPKMINGSMCRCTLQRLLQHQIQGTGSLKKSSKYYFSVSASQRNKKQPGEEEENLDKPIQFTTSKAAQLTASETLGGNPFPNAPWYQPYVVSFSVGIFLLYFLALREESDIDARMEKPLWEKVPGLEKQQLQLVLEYNRKHNLDTGDIEKRIAVLEREEALKASRK